MTNETQSTQLDDFDYLVALDFGSESMAACYLNLNGNPSICMIDLQAHAQGLLNGNNPKYLEDDQGRSKRLRTRISLQERVQPPTLPSSHAELIFVDRTHIDLGVYEQSLFQFFHTDAGYRDARRIIPNPKVPFQFGADKVIPDVYSNTDGDVLVDLTAKDLMQHLITQVVRNLVLNSPELRGVAPDRIHLTITVPNVYSLTHLQTLETFLRQHVGVASVSAIYESDAIAYFVRSNLSQDATMLEFNGLINKNCKDETGSRLITIDIGRGTTDLSVVDIAASVVDHTLKHTVLARTGKSDGGNRLSYIFAHFYNKRLYAVFDELGYLVGGNKPRFDFLTEAGLDEQKTSVIALDELINEIKSTIDGNCHVTLPAERQRTLLRAVTQPFVELLSLNVSSHQPEMQSDRKELFGKLLVESFVIPVSDRPLSSLFRNLFAKPRLLWTKTIANEGPGSATAGSGEPEPERLPIPGKEIESLEAEIRQYVSENIDTLVDRLVSVVSKGSKNPVAILKEKPTFVVVAGQAAQLAPMQDAIIAAFSPKYVPFDHIFFLPGRAAKEACCKGAVCFETISSEITNQGELHGCYGFVSPMSIGRGQFGIADMEQLNCSNAPVPVTTPLSGRHWLFFTERAPSEVTVAPRHGDGLHAFLGSFNGRTFTLRYDRLRHELFVGTGQGSETLVELAGFGQIPEDIWPKVWPERLCPAASLQ